MRILYIHQHFTTNAGASGTRSYDYARYLVQAGHKVTVVTGVYALGPFGRNIRGLIETRIIDGIRVVVVNVPYDNRMTFLSRVASFLLFAALSVVACLRQGRVDVVLATSTPLTVGIPALAMRWLRRVPYVFEVRDIWPEFAVSIGVLKNPRVIRLAYRAEALFYRFASRVQCISEGMRDMLAGRGLAAEKLTVVPTGVDLALYEGLEGDPSVRRSLGWEDRLIATYTGAGRLDLIQTRFKVVWCYMTVGAQDTNRLAPAGLYGAVKTSRRDMLRIINQTDVLMFLGQTRYNVTSPICTSTVCYDNLHLSA